MSGLAPPLYTNAALSFATGAAFLIASDAADQALGFGHPQILFAFGLSLIAHGVLLLLACRSAKVRAWTVANLFVIAPYPATLIILLAIGVLSGPQAAWLVIADAIAVGAVALWQGFALRTNPAT